MRNSLGKFSKLKRSRKGGPWKTRLQQKGSTDSCSLWCERLSLAPFVTREGKSKKGWRGENLFFDLLETSPSSASPSRAALNQKKKKKKTAYGSPSLQGLARGLVRSRATRNEKNPKLFEWREKKLQVRRCRCLRPPVSTGNKELALYEDAPRGAVHRTSPVWKKKKKIILRPVFEVRRGEFPESTASI